MYVMTAAKINLLVSTEREEEPFNSNSNNSSGLPKKISIKIADSKNAGYSLNHCLSLS